MAIGGGGGGGRVQEGCVPPPAQSAEPLSVCEVLSAQKGVIQRQIGNIIMMSVRARAALYIHKLVEVWSPQKILGGVSV